MRDLPWSSQKGRGSCRCCVCLLLRGSDRCKLACDMVETLLLKEAVVANRSLRLARGWRADKSAYAKHRRPFMRTLPIGFFLGGRVLAAGTGLPLAGFIDNLDISLDDLIQHQTEGISVGRAVPFSDCVKQSV